MSIFNRWNKIWFIFTFRFFILTFMLFPHKVYYTVSRIRKLKLCLICWFLLLLILFCFLVCMRHLTYINSILLILFLIHHENNSSVIIAPAMVLLTYTGSIRAQARFNCKLFISGNNAVCVKLRAEKAAAKHKIIIQNGKLKCFGTFWPPIFPPKNTRVGNK